MSRLWQLKSRGFWRRWLRGPKQGIGRGVAVYGSPGFPQDASQLTHLLAECRELRRWAGQQQLNLDSTSGSLTALDDALSAASPDVRQRLDNDSALYLGTVIVQHQPRARWRIWPNGHPVIRLATGRELDVVAAVHAQADAGQSRLAALYADATH